MRYVCVRVFAFLPTLQCMGSEIEFTLSLSFPIKLRFKQGDGLYIPLSQLDLLLLFFFMYHVKDTVHC